MEIVLTGKKALVGGSTQGLGKAIAMQLAKSGATVTLMARNEEKLQAVLAQLPVLYQQKHQYIKVDFTNFEEYRGIISNYLSHNTVDILVNNTNGPTAGTVASKNYLDYQAAFDLLFQTVGFTTLEVLKHMQQQGFGRIINLSSMTVKEPVAHLVLSNSIRSAVISWAKTLSRDVAQYNITVNNILTGYFDTERLNEINIVQAKNRGLTLEAWKQQMQADVPMKRFGKPEEFGYLVTFLASDLAAYITGVNIPIDGGLIRSV